MPSPRRQLLVIAGSGRSGTSLMAGLSGRLGHRIPLPELEADSTNPLGFGEPAWAVAFHDRLLRRALVGPEDGRPTAWDKTTAMADRPRPSLELSNWLDTQFTESHRVVVKDPRLAWFLDMYVAAARHLDADLCVITMVRHPAATIRSRDLAYGTRTSHAARLAGWVNMMLGTEFRTRHLRRAFVSYDSLVTDWRTALSHAETAVGLPLFGNDPVQHEEASGLIDPKLQRAAPDWSNLDIPAHLEDLALRVHQALEFLVIEPGQIRNGLLDELREEYAALYRAAEAISTSSARAARAAERRRAARLAASTSG